MRRSINVFVAQSAALVLAGQLLSCTPREGTEDSTPGADSAPGADSLPPLDTAARPQPASVPWEEARRRGIDFRAIGQEPGWMLEIDSGKTMYLLADYGEKKVTTPAPAPRDSAGTLIYEAKTDSHRLTVVILPTACQDTMSGEEMTHTVTVTLDGNEYRGCGRELVARG